MSTSLAEQLKRLATPQTGHLVDSKKRASILFDVTEAANKDREIIYDIALSGLHELSSINPAFLQFEQTLFDRSARDLVRSVESSEVNARLNKTIKRFLIHLSPHFLLQPAHKCLEWLIRRFHIHEYNVDDFVMLILPYHETRIFVRCVQILTIRDDKHRWHWLHVLQKPGIPLSKQVLFNRAATDLFFLKHICKYTSDAVKELDLRAYTLQSCFAFYCTTLLGVIDSTDVISEKQIAILFPAIAKGLSSTVADFCAASMMITGYLVTKAKLTLAFLEVLVQRMAKVTHPGLQTDAVVLLILCFQHQRDELQEISDESLQMIISNKWVPAALSKNYVEKISIMPFFVPLLTAILKNVQLKGNAWKACKTFCESLLLEITFTGSDAEDVIRCVFDAYVLRDIKPAPLADDVIMIESDEDEDEVELSETNMDVNQWYSDLLKSLERQYPNDFERITKEVMRSADKDVELPKTISRSKRRSLKTVLGFLFTAACSGDGANIFENLYHHNVEKRVAAMKYLVENLNNSGFSDDSKNLLRDSIAERLGDESPLVVVEALRFDTDSLVEMLDASNLVDKLHLILGRSCHNPKWQAAAKLAIGHITSTRVCTTDNWPRILLAVWPFLFPIRASDVPLTHSVIRSDLSRKVHFLKQCPHELKDCAAISQLVLNALSQSTIELSQVQRILATIHERLNEKTANARDAYFTVLLASNVIPSKCPGSTARKVLDIIAKVTDLLRDKLVVAADCQTITLTRIASQDKQYPIQLNLNCIEALLKSIDFPTHTKCDFSDRTNDTLQFQIHLAETLFDGIWTTSGRVNEMYQNTLRTFMRTTMNPIEQKVEFFSNFFVAHLIPRTDDGVQQFPPRFQVQAIRVFSEVLKQAELPNISISALIRILTGLSAARSAIRECTIDTLRILGESPRLAAAHVQLIQKLLLRSEEMALDENQFVLAVHRVFTKTKSLHGLLDGLFEFLSGDEAVEASPILHAIGLDMLKHINNGHWCRKLAAATLRVINSLAVQDSKQPVDVYRSTVIRQTLLRYTVDTVAVLRAPSDSWHIVVAALRHHRAVLQSFRGAISPLAPVALDVFDGTMFAALPPANRSELVRLVVHITSESPDADVLLAAGKFMRRIELDAGHHLDILHAMRSVDVLTAADDGNISAGKRRKSQSAQPLSTDILTTIEWRSGVALLEYMQNKRQIVNAHLLLPNLFLVLKRCLQFEDQSLVEYTKQLALACMLHCCQLISPDGQPKRSLIPDKVFEIELVVQCIRGTQNPQTHHHALQLLSHTAAMIPELVLHNMMNIFTFVGSSVVRRDDAYTYQIISNIIRSIIPTLIANTKKQQQQQLAKRDDSAVIPVLRVFADIVLDVPEHRRQRLYADLLHTLDARQYAWMFLAVMFESYVQNFQQTSGARKSATELAQLKRIEIAVDIINCFDCNIVLDTVTRLIDFLHRQPTEKPPPTPTTTNNNNKMGGGSSQAMDITDSRIFNINNYTDYQLRHFKYITMQFIIRLTEPASRFVARMASLNAADTSALKPQFKHIIVTVLQFIGQLHKLNHSANAEKIWKVLLANCYDILDQVLALIYPDMLLQVVSGLLNQNNIPEVRRKAIELLNKKLQLHGFFATCAAETLLGLLDPLTDIIQSINDDTKLVQTATSVENISLQQQSLIAIKLLSIQIGKDHPTAFRPLLNTLSTIVKSADAVPINVLAQSILCLAEVCSSLRAHSISHLSKFMPALDRILHSQTNKVHQTPNIVIYILTAIYKIVDTLPLFLSPYLVSLIVSLSTIWAKLLGAATTAQSPDVQRNCAKLEQIWAKLASSLTLRVLIPMIDQGYKRIVQERSEFGAVGPLMRLLAASLQPLAGTDIQPFQQDLGVFFVLAMQFRAIEVGCGTPDDVIADHEDHVISAFVGMVLKLSESSFRPLYYKMFDWATGADSSIDRVITFYRLSSKIAESLKSLFVLFASDFIPNAADLLAKSIKRVDSDGEPTDQQLPGTESKCIQLTSSIVRTLYFVFLHDSQGFVNSHRFDVLMQPLVDQLHNALVLGRPAVKEQIPACLAQLAVAANDDTAWKQLNFQILMKTRSADADVRQFALAAAVEVAKKLGDDFMPLLPETIPFFAEMLEDENTVVEKACQSSIQELERVLGEPLQKYF